MADTTTSTPAAATAPKGRVLTGIVTSDKMNKSRRVEIQRLVRHPKYGKFVKRRTVCHAHDEVNQSHVGDLVEIMETRPLSKLKRWRIIRIVRHAPQRALAGEGERQPERAEAARES